MNFYTFGSIFALMLAGCLPPKDDRAIPPKYINQHVMPVGGWDMGCDNSGSCIAITAVPPRKVRMNGIRGALRIDFGHPDGLAAGITIIPLDFEQRLPNVKPSLKQAEKILETLRDGDEFLIWQKDGLGESYYVPGQGFAEVEALYEKWLVATHVRWVQQEPIMPEKGVRLSNFRAPVLTEAQVAECKAANRGEIKSAWDIAAQFRLFEYACSETPNFYANSLWFTQERQTGRFAAIGIDEAVGPKTGGKAAGLYNAYFEPTQGLLVTRKDGGSADCGLVATYAATTSGFVLAERREARHCFGLFRGDWIRTYRDPAIVLPEAW